MDDELLTIHLRPLPPLLPLNPPLQVLQQLRLQIQPKSLTLSAVPEEQLQDDQAITYKELYQQKCEQEAAIANKCRGQEEIIKILQEKNASLEKEVTRLQDQRWKKFDYSRLSARGRSKSQKRVPPTIEVKVPKRMHMNKEILIDEEKWVKTDRDVYNEEMEYYREQIRECREENKELRKEIEILRATLKDKQQLDESREEPRGKGKSRSAKSPQKGWTTHNTSTPIISSFSPYPKETSQTVKKEMNGYDESSYELRKLKNEMMYKDLLLQKLKTDHSKQIGILKSHLSLSVIESKKVADQTAILFSEFKAEIVRLSQELQEYKQGRLPGDSSRRQLQKRESSQGELMNILKGRRKEDVF